jgi:membrane fusion protein (multidrug efflux system)
MKLKQVVYALLILGFAFITYRIIENKSKSSDSKGKSDKKKSNESDWNLVKTETFDNILSLLDLLKQMNKSKLDQKFQV